MVAVLDGHEVGETPIDELEREIVTWSATTSASMCRWLLLVAEFDRRQGYLRWERLSTASWLEWKCGIRTGTAHDHVRVARAIEGLPKIRRAFAAGTLSYSKVRALVRIATRDNQDDMLYMASVYTGNQLERMVNEYGSHVRKLTVSDLERMEAKRTIQRRRDKDGDGWIWTIHVSDEEDAQLQRGIDFVRNDGWAEKKKAARERGEEAERMSRVDAFLVLASMGLAQAVRADATMPDNYLVVVHAETEAMVGDDGLVHLGDGAVLHPRTAQRLACDAMAQLALDDAAGNILNLGRRARIFSRDQRTAISAREPTCGFPACSVPARYCRYHHVDHWTKGGPTDLDNGLPLCSRHHRSVHEGGWRLVPSRGGGGGDGAGGSWAAVAPDGRRMEPAVEVPGLAAGESPADRLGAAGVEVKPDYDPMFDPHPNLHYVLDTLLSRHFPETPTPEEIEACKRAVRYTFGPPPDPRSN